MSAERRTGHLTNKELVRKLAYAHDHLEDLKRTATPETVGPLVVVETILDILTGGATTYSLEPILDVFLAYTPNFVFEETA